MSLTILLDFFYTESALLKRMSNAPKLTLVAQVFFLDIYSINIRHFFQLLGPDFFLASVEKKVLGKFKFIIKRLTKFLESSQFLTIV